jgi:hypothetical protein
MKIIITGIYLLTFLNALSQNNFGFRIDPICGIWRIDSTAENGSLNKRDAVNEEYFVFLSSHSFLMDKVEDGVASSISMGSYRMESNMLITRNNKGEPFLNFIVTIDSTHLRLDGTFPISDSNSRKPTFYLSKVESRLVNARTKSAGIEDQILYRNVSNTVNICTLGDEYVVECPLCESFEKGELTDTYVLMPGRGRITNVLVKKKKSESEIISTLTFKTDNLPYPVLYYGKTRNSRKCNVENGQIFGIYPPEMNLNLNSNIERWELYAGDKKFEGIGNSISDEAIDFLKSSDKPEAFSIIAVVRGPDGIGRKISGVFSL